MSARVYRTGLASSKRLAGLSIYARISSPMKFGDNNQEKISEHVYPPHVLKYVTHAAITMHNTIGIKNSAH
jgi:hypothetical protein